MAETNNQTTAYQQARQEIDQRYSRRKGMAGKTALAGVIFAGLSALSALGADAIFYSHNEIMQKYNQALNDVAILTEMQRNYPISDISRISSKDLAEKARAQFPQVDLERDRALTGLVNKAQARVYEIKSSDDYVSSQSFSRRAKNTGLRGFCAGVLIFSAAVGYFLRQDSKRIKELKNLDAQRELA